MAIGQVTDLPQALRLVDPLDFTLQVLENAGRAVSVMDAEGHEVIGWLTQQAALHALPPAVASAFTVQTLEHS